MALRELTEQEKVDLEKFFGMILEEIEKRKEAD